MPFDGIVMKAVCHELDNSIKGGRIEKVNQPEKDEVLIQIYNAGKKYKLLLSANAANPRIHLTQASAENPSSPFNFCILLRKYLTGGRITGLFQHGLERILEINVEGANEIGDIIPKILVIEVMGKHSNIILLNENRKIIDCIKHIDLSTSRLREVMPGRDYIYPPTQDKLDPLHLFADEITAQLGVYNDINEFKKKLVNAFTGISPFISGKLADKANNSGSTLPQAFYGLMQKALQNQFNPYIIYGNQNEPLEFHCLLDDEKLHNHFDSISHTIDTFFANKSTSNKLNSKKADLLKLVTKRLDKCNKKISIQEDNISKVSDRENLRLSGELLTANLYRVNEGSSEVTLNNYYSSSNEEIAIKLDASISPSQNAQRFFKKYAKAKNTFEAAGIQLEKLLNEQAYLENVLYEIELCETSDDLSEIKDELISEGIINASGSKTKKVNKPSLPHQFISSEGFIILVGKNNRQNDKLTLKSAYNSDIWLHTKNIPGSHVIIKTEKREVPDTTLIEAAAISAYFSKARQSSNVPVDYTFVRNIKKPNGSKPGFVIYENFNTIYVTPEKELVEKLKTQ